MYIPSEDPELKKAVEACKKEIRNVIKKHFRSYLDKTITKWGREELKKMGYSEKENHARSDNNN